MSAPFVLRGILILLILSLFSIATGQILDYSTYVKINNGKKITTKSFEIQVNSIESRWISSISVHHDKSDEFKLKEAYITDKNGKVVRKIKSKDVKSRNDLSYSTFYQDDLIEEFDMYWNSFPYTIHYSYEIIESNYLFLAYWYPVIYTDMGVVKSKLEVEVSDGYTIQTQNEEPLKFSERIDDGKKILTWDCSNYNPPSSEYQMPPQDELLPMVYVSNNNFHYDIDGSSKNWENFSNWIYRLNADSYNLTTEEKIKVRKLIEGKVDDIEKARALYHYLQDNTTYINVSIDVGGLKSYPASYVCQNKYGDCKALTTYMKALLNYADINADYTIVNAGENVDRINTHIPNQQFNHVILSIPLEKDTIWLENTSNTLPFNYLGTFTQNRYSLPAKEKGGHLVKTPKLSAKQNSIINKYDISSENTESGEFIVQKTIRGSLFEDFCSLNKNYSKEEITPVIIDLLPFKNSKIEDWELAQDHRDSTFIELSISGKTNSLYRKVGDLLVLTPIHYPLPNYESPEKRKLPLRINLPLSTIDTINYQINYDNYEIQLPENILIKTQYGHYEVNYSKVDNKIKVFSNLLIERGEHTGENYSQFYNFIEKIKNYQKQSSIILIKNNEN